MNRWTQAYWARRSLALVALSKLAKQAGHYGLIAQEIASTARSLAYIGNLLRVPNEPSACETCGGSGILVGQTTPPRRAGEFSSPPTIERCDACKQFASDDEAAAEVRMLLGEGT